MRDFFSFHGRLNRLRYIGYSIIVSIIVGIIQYMTLYIDYTVGSIIYFLVAVAAFIISVSLTVKRLHDIDRPGIHYLLLLIPLYNIYLALVLLFKKGTEGANKYGPDPLSEEGGMQPV